MAIDWAKINECDHPADQRDPLEAHVRVDGVLERTEGWHCFKCGSWHMMLNSNFNPGSTVKVWGTKKDQD